MFIGVLIEGEVRQDLEGFFVWVGKVLVVLAEHGARLGAELRLVVAQVLEAVGLELDGSKFGLGTRSQRYAMVVDNGVIKQLFVEKPGAFEVSSAEHVLKHL